MGQELMLIRLNCCEECWGSALHCRGQFPLFLGLRTLGVIEWSLGPFIMVLGVRGSQEANGWTWKESFRERDVTVGKSHWREKMSLFFLPSFFFSPITTDTTWLQLAMKLMFTHDRGRLAALKLLPFRHGQLQKMAIRESVTRRLASLKACPGSAGRVYMDDIL